MSEDCTIGPLRCFACGKAVIDPNGWVQRDPYSPLYGLHHGCIGVKFEWASDGSPIVKRTLEQRVKELEGYVFRRTGNSDFLTR